MKVGSRDDQPVEVVIDRHSLSLDNGCELNGLTGRVQVRSDLKPGRLWYVRIGDSPGLRFLDLTELPAGFDLEIESSSHPDQVILPSGGASVLLRITRGFPSTRYRGWIDECQILCLGGHPVAGFYRLSECDGLALLPSDALKREKNITRYVRIDQSERGLQSKSLRPRVKPDEVFWSLVNSRDDKHRAVSRLMTMRPDEFSRLALSSSRGIERRRRELLEARPCANLMKLQLLRMSRRGFNLRAIWAWHCMVQRARAMDRAPERLGPALLATGPGRFGDVSASAHPLARDLNDLRLLLACRATGLARRSERQLSRHGEPLALPVLVALAASLPGGHPWSSFIETMIRASMHRWEALAALTREDVDRNCRQAWYIATRPESARRFLEKLAHHADRLPPGNLRARLIDFLCARLEPRDRIALGVRLHEGDVPESGRHLILSGLQASPDCGPRLHARAVRCLLGRD